MKDLKLIKSVIAEQNPWWKELSVPNHLAPLTERPLAKHLWKYILSSSLKRHLIILGPRRVGKTTVMYQTVRHLLNNQIPPDKIQWVRLDHPLFMPFDLGSIVKEAIELARATKEKPLYLFLDELVYAENWDKWLKTFYDEHWPIHIIASSSATAALQKGKESGVGRWEEFYLTPYLLTELLQLYDKNIKFPTYKKEQCLHNTIESLFKSLSHTQLNFENERKLLISLGGFPEFLAGKKREEEKFLESIEKDIEKRLAESPEILEIKRHIQNLQTEDMQIINAKHIPEIEEKISKMKKDTISKFKKIYIKQTIDNFLVKEDSYFRKAQQILRSDAIERAVYKDIPQSYRIDNPITLERLLYVLAGQITGLLSPKGISKDISQVSTLTLERYLNYLIQTYLVFTLSNYDNNERNVQRRQRKAYFVDVAIRNAALLKEQDQIFNDLSELGKLQENLVASHLYHLGKQSGIRLYHWKRGKHEVDFIYDDPVHPMAFEIGMSKNHSRSGLKKFLEENSKFHKGAYYVAPGLQFLSAEDSSSGVGELPLDLLLLATGLQQDKSLSLLLKSTE